MVMKVGIPSVVGGWIIYGVILLNSFQNQIPIPDEYAWIKQVIALIPVIAGHHVLAWRIYK